MPASPVATVDIERLSPEGDGVGRLDGREVVVPRVIPGERVRVQVRATRDGRLEGEVVEVVSPSRHRITPRCRHFGPCGGCAWQHIDYPEQLRLKQVQLQHLLDREMGARAPRVSPTVPSPARAGEAMPWGYRNKVSFVFAPGDERGDSVVMGHFWRGSRRVLPVVECPVHAETGNRVAFTLRDALRRARVPGATPDGAAGIARHVVVRVGEHTADWLATLVVTENVKALRRVTPQFLAKVTGRPAPADSGAGGETRTGFHLNLHDRDDPFLFGRTTRRLHGAPEIRERVAGVTFLLAPTAFFQTNVRVASAMAEGVLDALPSDAFPRVLDLYSGVGLFALPIAARGAFVTAVEENRDAVAAAESARRFNRLPESRLKLLAARVEDALPRITARTTAEGFDAVVVDPPRQGCPPVVLDWILRRVQPRLLVYVSCNPAALAGDLAAALAAGYTAGEVRPFDMFPHTAHIESIALLSR